MLPSSTSRRTKGARRRTRSASHPSPGACERGRTTGRWPGRPSTSCTSSSTSTTRNRPNRWTRSRSAFNSWGVSIAMAHDVAETTAIPRPPNGREPVRVQVSRLLHPHEIILKEARTMARSAAELDGQGTNDLLVSDVIRTNELQVWVRRRARRGHAGDGAAGRIRISTRSSGADVRHHRRGEASGHQPSNSGSAAQAGWR